MKFNLVVLILFTCQLAMAQIKTMEKSIDPRISATDWAILEEQEDTMGIFSYATLHDTTEINRMASCKLLITKLVSALKVENSFYYPFDQLKTVSIQYPPDSSFRIFTWQLFVNDNEYRYYGAIQLNNKELKLIPLIDRSMNIKDPETEIVGNDKWYGGIYYRILPFETPVGTKYLLFGYDAFEFWFKRKFIDVLSFDSTGKAIFGAPVFVKNTPEESWTKNRFVMEYSSESSVTLNYANNMDLIVFDNLEEIPSNNPENGGMLRVPDGTYDAFELKNGVWTVIVNLPNQVLEEAPRPLPVLNGKDLNGN